MYYIRIDAENTNKLIYYCRNCGDEDTTLTVDNVCVSRTNIQKGEQNFVNIINKYTKLDPTLPRVNNILCPNADCDTNIHDKPREIISIRYDEINLKYIYMCSSCDKVWNVGLGQS
jgi:hypothetical protein